MSDKTKVKSVPVKSNIRKLRNEKKISQTTLAEVIGKTQQAVSHMERDRDRIPIESLIIMSDYFGVSTDYILGLEEEPPDPALKIKEDPPEQKDLKDEMETIKSIANGGNAKMLYELVLSMLLCSLEENLQSDPLAKEYG